MLRESAMSSTMRNGCAWRQATTSYFVCARRQHPKSLFRQPGEYTAAAAAAAARQQQHQQEAQHHQESTCDSKISISFKVPNNVCSFTRGMHVVYPQLRLLLLHYTAAYPNTLHKTEQQGRATTLCSQTQQPYCFKPVHLGSFAATECRQQRHEQKSNLIHDCAKGPGQAARIHRAPSSNKTSLAHARLYGFAAERRIYLCKSSL